MAHAVSELQFLPTGSAAASVENVLVSWVYTKQHQWALERAVSAFVCQLAFSAISKVTLTITLKDCEHMQGYSSSWFMQCRAAGEYCLLVGIL